MNQSKPNWRKIDQRLTSAPYSNDALTWQAVAHLTGWQLTHDTGAGRLSAALVQIQPTTLLVRHGAEEVSLPLTADPVGMTQTTLLRVALAISGFCALVMVLARRMATRRA